MLNTVRAKVSKRLWRVLLNTADGPRMALGSIEVLFSFVNQDREWIPSQARAVSEVEKLFASKSAEAYSRSVFDEIKEILFCNTGHDKYEAHEHRIFLKYVPKYTDNHIYLASRLVEIASLMETQYSGTPKEQRLQVARQRQLAFLTLFPEASSVKDWLLKN